MLLRTEATDPRIGSNSAKGVDRLGENFVSVGDEQDPLEFIWPVAIERCQPCLSEASWLSPACGLNTMKRFLGYR